MTLFKKLRLESNELTLRIRAISKLVATELIEEISLFDLVLLHFDIMTQYLTISGVIVSMKPKDQCKNSVLNNIKLKVSGIEKLFAILWSIERRSIDIHYSSYFIDFGREISDGDFLSRPGCFPAGGFYQQKHHSARKPDRRSVRKCVLF